MRALRKVTLSNLPLTNGAVLFGDHDIFFFKRRKHIQLNTKLNLVKKVPLSVKKITPPDDAGIVRLSWSF